MELKQGDKVERLIALAQKVELPELPNPKPQAPNPKSQRQSAKSEPKQLALLGEEGKGKRRGKK